MIPFVFCESAHGDRLYARALGDPRAEITEGDPQWFATLAVDFAQLAAGAIRGEVMLGRWRAGSQVCAAGVAVLRTYEDRGGAELRAMQVTGRSTRIRGESLHRGLRSRKWLLV